MALVAYSVIRLHTRRAWQGVVLLTVLYLHRPAGNLFSWEPFLVTQLDLSGSLVVDSLNSDCPFCIIWPNGWIPDTIPVKLTKLPFNVAGEVLGIIQKQHQSSLRVIQGQEADGDFVWATEL